jgi:predicted nucleotidyltransferase
MTPTTTRPEGDSTLEAYVAEVARRVDEVAGDRLVGVWLLGSAALDDYDPARSDVDVQAVTTERLGTAERERLVGRLAHEALPNPARGLEFVLYAREDLTDAAGPRLQLNLNTGARMERHVAYDADEEPQFWFTIDVSIARQHGRPLVGPPRRRCSRIHPAASW